jgi:hypothetical protein
MDARASWEPLYQSVMRSVNLASIAIECVYYPGAATMRIATTCPFCDYQNRKLIPIDVELNNDLFLTFTCENGHENTRYIETERFSVLFDSGMFALEDGYSREAVASFAASVERMYEFFIRVVCRKHAVEEEALNGTWKQVANQSERQLGAFCLLYLLTKKESPKSPPMVEFRNKVIHKGYIPSCSETMKYACEIHDYIIGIVRYMNAELIEFVQEVHAAERIRITKGIHNSNMSVKHYVPFMTAFTKYYTLSLAEKLKKKKSYRWLFPGSGPIQSIDHMNNLQSGALIFARQTGIDGNSTQLLVADASDMEWE